MRIALCTSHPFPPQIFGGAQSSMLELAKALQAAGQDVAIFSGLTKKGLTGLRARLTFKLSGAKIARSDVNGIAVHRAWFPHQQTDGFIDRFRPDVAMLMSGNPVEMSAGFMRRGVRTAIYFRNVEVDDFGGDPRGAADTYLANSNFTREFLKTRFGIESHVIPPLFLKEKYQVDSGRKNVLFINPHPNKGRDIVFELVRRCPDIDFHIVKAWTLESDDQSRLDKIGDDCPNVKISDPVSDMRQVYREAKIVLMPSRWNEAWGRVATEAQFSGIPVIATAIGGLPESVGPGGMLLPLEAGADEWERALRESLREERYLELSGKALEYSRRPAIDPDGQAKEIMSIIS